MKQYNKIDGLSLLCFDDENNWVPIPTTATKRASCSTQRTSSRGSRSIDSDLNSLLDSGCLSFGEKPFNCLDAQESVKKERNDSHKLCTSLSVHIDSPRQRKDPLRSKEIKCDAKLSCIVFSSGSPVQQRGRHHQSRDSIVRNRKEKRLCNSLHTVHTLTEVIPLFEHESKTKKNASSDESICKRSAAFRYFSRKQAAIHDESVVAKECKITPNLIKEHRIEKEYDFYAKGALTRHVSRRSCSRENTMKATAKRSDRFEKRQCDRNNVHQQVKVFMEGCTIEPRTEHHPDT